MKETSQSLHSVSGSASLSRNLDVGEMLRLRGLLGEADRLLMALLPIAEASLLRLPGYDSLIADTRSYLHTP